MDLTDGVVRIVIILSLLGLASCTRSDVGEESVGKKGGVLQEKPEPTAVKKVEEKQKAVAKDVEKKGLVEPPGEKREETDTVSKPAEIEVKETPHRGAEQPSAEIEVEIPPLPKEPQPPVITESPFMEDYLPEEDFLADEEEPPQYTGIEDGPPPDDQSYMDDGPPLEQYDEMDDGPPVDQYYDVDDGPPLIEHDDLAADPYS